MTERPLFDRFEYQPNPTVIYNEEVVDFEQGQDISVQVKHF